MNTAQMCTKEGQRVPLLVRMNDDILAGAGDGMGWDDGQATTSDKALKINSLSLRELLTKSRAILVFLFLRLFLASQDSMNG